MSALSDLTQTTGSSTTTLPSWYDTAQQNLVNQASAASSAAPQLSQTVGQGAINTLQNPNNPFTQATNSLGSIASGAANPWITDPTTGAVTPNTSTAMGGLFAAQRDQLNQMLPTLTAGTEAGAIGSGNFGSLRGQTAVDTSKANALSTLAAQQMQSALQNQSTGVNAGIGQGNVANQQIANQMNVGQEQMTAPFTNAANYGNILASISAPQTVNTSQTPSGLQQITGLGSTVAGGLNALLPSSTVDKFGNAVTNPGLWTSLFGSGTQGTSGYVPGFFSPSMSNPSSAPRLDMSPTTQPTQVSPELDPGAYPTTPTIDPLDPNAWGSSST